MAVPNEDRVAHKTEPEEEDIVVIDRQGDRPATSELKRISQNRDESPTVMAEKSSIAYGMDVLNDPLVRLTGWGKGTGEAEVNEG